MINKFICFLSVTIIVSFLGLNVNAAVLPDGDDTERLVGLWFGTHQQDGIDGDIQTLTKFNPDGTFLIRFRLVQGGKAVGEQSESGTWELKNNIKTMVTTHIGVHPLPQDKVITDSYTIYKLTNTEMHYEHIKTGTRFKATRVQEGFVFP